MGSINYAGNTYAGDVLEDLLVYTVQENDTYKEGLIHIVPGVQKKKVLPHITLGSIIQDNVATPTSSEGGVSGERNKYTLAERYLEPQDFMVYLEFNPRDFEEYWKPFQPNGELIFRELDPKVQATMLRLLISRKNEYIGDAIWCSRKGGEDASHISSTGEGNVVLGSQNEAGPMKYFDGVLMRVLNNLSTKATDNEKASGKVIKAGDTELTTGEQVQTALYTMYQKCPKQLRKSTNICYVMGWELWDLYDQYLTSKDTKYTENADVNKFRFKGKAIKVINGIPEQTIFLGRFTSGMDSCLWMGVDYNTDQDSIKIAPLQANSEMWFFQMRLKVDVNIVLPSEIVVWTTYKLSEGD